MAANDVPETQRREGIDSWETMRGSAFCRDRNFMKRLGITRANGPVVPSTVWVLGVVSLLMDASSELVHSLLPLFMASVLGASTLTIGFVEGVAEATAAVVKIFSGTLSDWFGKRKLLLVLGYGLSAFTKPVFPLATSMAWVFGARFADRIGKGIRGAPRDAFVADITPPAVRGAAYGLRQALDSIGAFVGPLLAVLLMYWLMNDIRAVLWFAAVPAVCAVTLLLFAIREPEHHEVRSRDRERLTLADLGQFRRGYWVLTGLGLVLTLARFSEAFLVLRAQDVGLAIGYVPAVMIVMNVIYASSAYPAGWAADRFSVRVLLLAGIVCLVLADLTLAWARTSGLVFIGTGLWGLHMGLTQGLFSKLVAAESPPSLRGTAFGMFNLMTGVGLLLASVIAGFLWTVTGPSMTFLAGALFAGIAALGIGWYHPSRID